MNFKNYLYNFILLKIKREGNFNKDGNGSKFVKLIQTRTHFDVKNSFQTFLDSDKDSYNDIIIRLKQTCVRIRTCFATHK